MAPVPTSMLVVQVVAVIAAYAPWTFLYVHNHDFYVRTLMHIIVVCMCILIAAEGYTAVAQAKVVVCTSGMLYVWIAPFVRLGAPLEKHGVPLSVCAGIAIYTAAMGLAAAIGMIGAAGPTPAPTDLEEPLLTGKKEIV